MWTEQGQQEMMIPFASKMLGKLSDHGISFSNRDYEPLDNVVFMNVDQTVKMSHHSFYKYSGMAVPPDFWYDNVMYPIIMKSFGLTIKKGKK